MCGVAKGSRCISSHTDVHTFFNALGSRMEAPHPSCFFQLYRRAFPLSFFLLFFSCVLTSEINDLLLRDV